jgi:hypothetical protein
LELACGGNPRLELGPLNHLPRGVAGIRKQQCGQSPTSDLPAQLVQTELVSLGRVQQDRNRGEELEDVEQLLVGRVVGQEMPQIDVAQRGDRSRERATPTTAYADVTLGVLRRTTVAIEPVVQLRHRTAQLPDSRDRRVFLIV